MLESKLFSNRIRNKNKTKSMAPTINAQRWRFYIKQLSPLTNIKRSYGDSSKNITNSVMDEDYLYKIEENPDMINHYGCLQSEKYKKNTNKNVVSDLVKAAYSRLNMTYIPEQNNTENKEELKKDKPADNNKKPNLIKQHQIVDESYQILLEKEKDSFNLAKAKMQENLVTPKKRNSENRLNEKSKILSKKQQENYAHEPEQDLSFVLPPIEKLNSNFGRYAQLIKREAYSKDLPILRPILEPVPNILSRNGNKSTLAKKSTLLNTEPIKPLIKSNTKNKGQKRKLTLVQRLAEEIGLGKTPIEIIKEKQNGERYISSKLAEQIKSIKDILGIEYKES